MTKREFTPEYHKNRNDNFKSSAELIFVKARRTAFLARFIVLRESKRSRAHRKIEEMSWADSTTAEELAKSFYDIFVENNDNLENIERDIRRALEHSSRSIEHFVEEYLKRATTNFVDALEDYDRSNSLLFGEDEQPKMGGWQLTSELRKKQRSRTT